MTDRTLILAALAAARAGDPARGYRVGAAARRRDGVVVRAHNSAAVGGRCYGGHAEARLIRKLDRTAVACVVRLWQDGALAIAKPCGRCAAALRSRGVQRVVYSVSGGWETASL